MICSTNIFSQLMQIHNMFYIFCDIEALNWLHAGSILIVRHSLVKDWRLSDKQIDADSNLDSYATLLDMKKCCLL